MKIKDFHITGQYPALSVETEIETGQSDGENSETVRLELGPWNYVSLLSESELKSLVHLVYQKRRTEPTQAMTNLRGTSLQGASSEEMP